MVQSSSSRHIITIRDVARIAKVSVATVSRVINNSGPVSGATRLRIERVAAKLRYSPNGAARSLITSKTSTLGVLLPDLYGEFFSEVIRGIDQRAQRHGYHVIVSSSHNDRREVEIALGAMRGRVDGLIVMSPDVDPSALEANFLPSLPVVLLNCAVKGDAFDTLNIDNAAGAQAMTNHLIGLGHARIAFIQGAARNHDADERLKGYRAALKGARLERHEQWEPRGDFTESGGYRAAMGLLKRRPRPTAIFAANDSMAIGALSALHDGGVVVPDEMAMAGFDDIPIARYTSPPLSSVHVPINRLGEWATDKVLHAISHKNEHRRKQELLATTLVIRQSCGGSDAKVPSRAR